MHSVVEGRYCVLWLQDNRLLLPPKLNQDAMVFVCFLVRLVYGESAQPNPHDAENDFAVSLNSRRKNA